MNIKTVMLVGFVLIGSHFKSNAIDTKTVVQAIKSITKNDIGIFCGGALTGYGVYAYYKAAKKKFPLGYGMRKEWDAMIKAQSDKASLQILGGLSLISISLIFKIN
jgi:hypothetical protein